MLTALLTLSMAIAADAPAGELNKTSESATRPYEQQMNVVYDEVHGIALVMDIFVPTGRKNGLGIVDIASGSYYSDRGKIEDHRRARMYDIFCGDGYTVFAIRPGSISKFTLPEQLANVKQAIRWVKAHHATYGVDPARLGLTGASAGGHLCCLAAVTADSGKPSASNALQKQDTKVKAACAFFPPTDYAHWGKRNMDQWTPEQPLPGFLGPMLFPKGHQGNSKEQIEEAIRKISPARLVTSAAPPFLLVHGDADPIVPLQQSQIMLESLRKAGVPAELVVKKGGAHPWPTIHEEVRVAADWFNKQLVPAATGSATSLP